jgi:hypothetical protein
MPFKVCGFHDRSLYWSAWKLTHNDNRYRNAPDDKQVDQTEPKPYPQNLFDPTQKSAVTPSKWTDTMELGKP